MACSVATNLVTYQSASSLSPTFQSCPRGTSPVFISPSHFIPPPTYPRCTHLQLHARPTRDDELVAVFRNSRMHCHASNGSGSISTPAAAETEDVVPTPIVLIDQESDNTATVVELSFGDRLGALLDTMKALKDLGLDVVKGNVSTEASIIRTKFFITRSNTGRKVENPELLEAIRLTIIRNLLKYHPESSECLAMGEAWGVLPPKKKLDVDIATHITITEDGPKRSLLAIETADRPGLLMEIVKIMADINVNVESAEIDTEGLVAKDKFHVNYRGAALTKSISEVLTNCLRYYLRRPETDDESY